MRVRNIIEEKLKKGPEVVAISLDIKKRIQLTRMGGNKYYNTLRRGKFPFYLRKVVYIVI